MITGGTPIGNLHLPTSGDQLSGTFRLLPVHIPHRVLQEALSCVLGECLDWERRGLVTWGYMLWEKGIIEGNIRVNRFSWIYWMCPKMTDILYTSILMGNWRLYKIWMELGYPSFRQTSMVSKPHQDISGFRVSIGTSTGHGCGKK